MRFKPYPHKSGKIVRWLFPRLQWFKPSEKPTIYLTFDDGPIPEITEEVLSILKKFDAKATFFCIGDNVSKHPEVFQKVVQAGHTIGNHTHNHLNGWKNENQNYYENINKCKKTILDEYSKLEMFEQVSLFRPPYGRLTPEQVQKISTEYQIIMWDVLTGDFDKFLSRKVCLKKSIECTESGSIVTFHDSIKASKNMLYVLPRYLEHFTEKGFVFERL
ncbi:putative xylanase/chitin deacetylase [Bernardetia litoralis DSM 6794]|uniref:Putative xylanase/chitin deacetylase n=1 Tax=Bernardetia litoralis (strain ATCC 23117 / DSM 6794 / NBRC 15988 / NCIMB 1366 / Fx l1 / Sio-4) TaxID=880071 RepID=I4AQ12_BERLS|nr:polysaccharide deacetylase family protein [Bernardetia litoralis]AFM06047.1 putative xylanase/chitin deacetylase [Bernardetia litoralis DSM 6794]